MTSPGSGSEPSVVEREAQRAAEQEALRNVRRLTESLEEEQRARRRMQKLGFAIGAVAILVLLYFLVSVFVKGRTTPPPAKIEVPQKIELPKK